MTSTFLRGGLLALSVSTLVAGMAEAADVNIYSSRQPALIQPLLDAFTKETGLSTATIFIEKGLEERVKAEGDNSPADVILTGALMLIVAVGEFTHSDLLPSIGEAVAGMGNTGLITVGLLFVVVAGLVQTGAMELVAAPIIGHPRTARTALLRLLTPVTLLSAFLNNTPVVAMFMPVIEDICKRTRISPSKLYIPMAYAATFGGVCTLVGTSTNLIVQGLLAQNGMQTMNMFDLAWVGVPCAVAGVLYFLVFGQWLLPDRRPPGRRSGPPPSSS